MVPELAEQVIEVMDARPELSPEVLSQPLPVLQAGDLAVVRATGLRISPLTSTLVEVLAWYQGAARGGGPDMEESR